MSNELVSYQQHNKVGYITFNRPPANAYNLAFYNAFYIAVEQANLDSNVGAVVIQSNSVKFFCAGADIKEFQANTTADNQIMVEQARKTLAAIEASGKIFIAQISGHALGGGLEIIMACDLRFAATGSYLLGLPEIKLGLIPGNGGTQRLLRLVGVSRAMDILASGDAFSIDEAFRIGLINRLIDADKLVGQTINYAENIAKGPLLALAATKRALQQGSELSLAEGLQKEQQLVEPLYQTHDAAEGFNAFVEKRAAEFTGR